MPVGSASGKTFKVTTLVDENDGGSGGTGLSLREAIAQANANPGIDKISFKASLKNGTIVLEKGTLDITDGLNIKGLGADKLAISGNNTSSIFSVADDTLIEGLTIKEGKRTSDSFFGEAAIYNSSSLTLKKSVITGNTDGGSSATNSYAIANVNGTLNIVDSTVSKNGIGILNENGTLTVQRSTISGHAKEGILGNFGETSVSNSTISDNQIGIQTGYATVKITDSVIKNNDEGIGAYASSHILVRSQVTGNGSGINGSARLYSSTVANNTDFGIYSSGQLTVVSSTVSGNGGDGVIGGYFAPVNLVNSTISGNGGNGLTTESGPGYEAPITILNTTITGNGGFGVDATNPQLLSTNTIGNAIVAGNLGSSDLFGVFVSAGNNLIGNDDASSGFTNGVNGDLVGTTAIPIDAGLGALANNGGTTQTHALLIGSGAIDGGNNSIIPTELVLFPGLGANGIVPVDLSFDQRDSGFDRIVNGTIDIGAFEVQMVARPTPGDTILGTDRKDKLQGSDGDDRIEGLAGNDKVNGKAGDDIIVGGIGKDDVTGGIGSDSFVFESLQDKGDIIRDFEVGTDVIDLSDIFSASQFAGFSDSAGRFENYVRVRSRSSGVSVEVDQRGDNGTKFVRMAFVKNVDVADLSISDFQLT